MSLRKLALAILTAGTAACGLAAQADAGQYDGVTVTVLTRSGPVIAQRVREHGEEFTKMTGAKVIVNEVPFAELFQKIQTDWSTGTNSIDIGLMQAGWGVELANAGFIEDLSPYIEKDSKIDLQDYAPYEREYNMKIGGKTMLILIDGDFQMVYYRKDVLDKAGLKPPQTWDDYLAIAKAVNGQDMNGDGKPDYGSCMFKKRNAQSYFAVMTIASSFVQSKGTGEGLFFDTETMKPKVNNEAWAEAFRIYKAAGEYGPPEELNHDIGDTRALVQSGRCALTIDWGDIGPLSIAPEGKAIKDKMYSVITPGSKRVLDNKTGKLVDCTAETCPYAKDGISHAPFAAFGGWGAAVNAKSDPKVKAAAYDFLSYVSQPAQSNVDVTIGWTGYNPYRNSQLNSTENWVKAGFSEDAAKNYLGAIKDSLNSPNMASDIRIPGAQQYTGVILDRELARFLAGEIQADEALKNIESGWDEVTEDFGRDKQREVYLLSLGITNK